jgi:hypothetical protein
MMVHGRVTNSENLEGMWNCSLITAQNSARPVNFEITKIIAITTNTVMLMMINCTCPLLYR